MAERRTVSVGLVANVSNYVANMNRAAQATRDTAGAMVGSSQQMSAQAEVFTKIGEAAIAGGGVAAAGLAVIIKATNEYGSKMAQLQSLSHASQGDMKKMSAAAMEAGKAYGYSASQVADAEIELTKAGFSTAQMLGGGLKSALSLAAAGQLDVSQATGITTVALTQFQLKASDLPHVADMLAAGADKALGSVGDLGEALSNGGSQAAAMGLSIQDTVGVLSSFANAGIIGAEAGTQLRSMFMQLQKPSKQAQQVMDQYGISVYDAQGKFVGLTNLAGQLQTKLGGLSAAQQNAAKATIFGSYAVQGANVLIREGAKGMAAWTAKVNEYGFANAQASGKMNSLSGDLQKLSASFDTNLIKAGSGANDALRGIVQNADGLLNVIGEIPAPVLSTGTALVAAAAGVGLLGGASLVAAPKIAAFKLQMAEAGVAGKSILGTFGKSGALVLGITAVVGAMASLNQNGQASTQQLALSAQSMGKNFKNLDTLFFDTIGSAASAKSALQSSFGGGLTDAGWYKAIDGITQGVTHFSDVYKTNEGQFAAFGEQLAGLSKQDYSAAAQSFSQLVNKMGGGATVARQALDAMPAYKDSLVDLAQKAGVAASTQNLVAIAQRKGAVGAKVLAAVQKEAAQSAKEQANAVATLAGASDRGTTSIKALKAAIDGLDGGQLSARDAARGYQQAIDDATAAAKKNGRTLDINTQAGRDNQAALDGIATAAKASADAYLDAGGSAAGASKIVRNGRKAYVDAAIAMGLSRSAAEKLASSILSIPKAPKITVHLDDAAARKQIRDTAIALAQLDGKIAKVYIQAVNQSKVPSSVSGALIASGRAEGGPITGTGPKGKDSVLIYAAPGEHMWTARETDAVGGHSAMEHLRAAALAGDLEGYATGGQIKKGKKKPAKKKPAKKKAPQDAIAEALAEAEEAAGQARFDAKRIADAKRRATAARKRADRLQNAYEAIDGTKKNRARKAAAKKAAEAADKSADRAEKRVDTEKDFQDKATKSGDDALAKVKQLRYDKEDFASSELRGGQDPLGYVDQLRSMSRDENFSPAKRKKFADEAAAYEKTITKLNTKSEANAKALEDSTKKLDDNKAALDETNQQLETLKSTAAQLASSTSSSILGKYAASSAVTAATEDQQVQSGWMIRDGVRVANTKTVKGDKGGETTVDTLKAYNSDSATSTGFFAGQLQQLANRGIDRAYLAEIAADGPEQGGAIARALLSASDSDFSSINSNYAATAVNADRAGSIVSDYTYGSAIAAQQANVDAAQATVKAQQAIVSAQQAAADKITAQLAKDGTDLRKEIGKAFGLTGYAAGTSFATPGLHLVGEDGPELVTGPRLARFGGGERVYNRGQTASYLRGGSSSAGGIQRVIVQPTPVQMPDTITVQDASGFTHTMRVVAQQEIAMNAHTTASMAGWGAAG